MADEINTQRNFFGQFGFSEYYWRKNHNVGNKRLFCNNCSY